MPHVSRYKLSSDQITRLSQRMVDAIFMLRERNAIALFFDDLLTATEKIMLGKRLLIALLLEKDYSYADIGSILKVSDATIGSISERLQRGGAGFRLVLKKIEKQEKIEKALSVIFGPLVRMSRISSKTSVGLRRAFRSV